LASSSVAPTLLSWSIAKSMPLTAIILSRVATY
jgi:hypothetical protein